jgi:hypothetical protein
MPSVVRSNPVTGTREVQFPGGQEKREDRSRPQQLPAALLAWHVPSKQGHSDAPALRAPSRGVGVGH